MVEKETIYKFGRSKRTKEPICTVTEGKRQILMYRWTDGSWRSNSESYLRGNRRIPVDAAQIASNIEPMYQVYIARLTLNP